MTRPPQKPEEPSWLRLLALIVEALRGLAWPAIALLGMIAFFPYLNSAAEELTKKLKQANKVSIGSFSLEVEIKARELGNSEFATKVGQLTAGAVEQLLRAPRGGAMGIGSAMEPEKGKEDLETRVGLPKEETIAAWLELEKKGFISFEQPLNEYVSFVRSLPLIESQTHLPSDYIWYRFPYGQKSKEYAELRAQRFSLTASGRLAAEAIVKAVAAQLPRGDT